MDASVAESRVTLGRAKRIALTLAAGQAIVGAAAPISVSMGGLAGTWLLAADKSLATAPVTGYTAGVALGALPAAMLMRAVGRKNGFVTGALITAVGGATATIALFQHSFWVFVFSLLLVGMGGSFVQQYRFAAADNAPPSFRPKAISWVLGGGVFAAVIGPETAVLTRNLFEPTAFAGAFLSICGLGMLGALVLSTIRIKHQSQHAAEAEGGPERPLPEIILQPRFLVAFACAVGSYALMSFVMTGAPIAMVQCGFSPDEAAVGISFHVMAMFAPSFVTGRLIARFGRERIIGIGLGLLGLCAAVALTGVHLWQFWLALVLLGVGWNFGFIGATTMLTDAYRRSERNKVQGLHDFLLFSTVAFASLMSGFTLNAFGWSVVNWVVFPIVAFCLLLLGSLVLHGRRSAANSPAE